MLQPACVLMEQQTLSSTVGFRAVSQRITKGTLVHVVGPSGAGKDTLLAGARWALAKDDRFVFPHRIITRETDSGAEQHVPITIDAFRDAERLSAFFLSWRSHGLAYALPGTIAAHLERGLIVVVNVSRTVIPAAEARAENVTILNVSASPAILAARLATRGREAAEAIRPRLERVVPIQAQRAEIIEIANDGAVEAATADFIAALQHLTAARPGPAAR